MLAIILDEITAAQAEHWLLGACVSAVNLTEVVARLADLGLEDELIASILAQLDLDVRPFDDPQARRAGLLRRQTRQSGLSLGDRACLSLAATLDRPAVTADKAWGKLDIGIAIEQIR
jgi:ribonuclease VapC